MKIHPALLALAFASLAFPASAAEIIRSTADGKWGADSMIQGGKTSSRKNYGAISSLVVKNQGAHRKVFLRFDLEGVDPHAITRAQLRLTPSTLTLSEEDLASLVTFRVYGLNDASTGGESRLGEDWLEGDKTGDPAAEGELSAERAPAFHKDDRSASVGDRTTDGGQAMLVGTFSLDLRPVDKPLVALDSETSRALLAFLRADTNGHVTFILTRATGRSGTNTSFHSKENTGGHPAPALVLTTE